jgi:general secretion pathway protein J
MKPIRGNEGFTLVETLASLAVLALLSLLLTAGMQYGRIRLTRLDAESTGESIEAAQDALRARLRDVFPTGGFTGATPVVEFDGDADRVAFMAPPPAAEAPSALRHYTLLLSPSGDLTLNSISDVAADASQTERVVLLRGVSSLHLDYFGATAADGQTAWRQHWAQQSSLPRLVRMRLEFPQGDRRVWPTLLVAPAATLDSLCVIDANTGGCRGRA